MHTAFFFSLCVFAQIIKVVCFILACCLYCCVCDNRVEVNYFTYKCACGFFLFSVMSSFVFSFCTPHHHHWPVSQLSRALTDIMQTALLYN